MDKKEELLEYFGLNQEVLDSENFNDSSRAYKTDNSESTSVYEEIQIRLNNILQNRKQLPENLSGSQISHILDFFVEKSFLTLTIRDIPKDLLLKALKDSFTITLDFLIISRRKLLSTRFTNDEIYDTLVRLLFEKDPAVFSKDFCSLRLNRGLYLDFLERVYTKLPDDYKVLKGYFKVYKTNYLFFKNLLLGNYLRFIMSDTNRFINLYRGVLSPESKEDYFCGLVLVVLNVIDKYDSYKGTLTSYIENWFKDYKTVFKKDYIDPSLREIAITPENEDSLYADIVNSYTDNDKDGTQQNNLSGDMLDDFYTLFLEQLFGFLGIDQEKSETTLTRVIKNNATLFPEIYSILVTSRREVDL